MGSGSQVGSRLDLDSILGAKNAKKLIHFGVQNQHFEDQFSIIFLNTFLRASWMRFGTILESISAHFLTFLGSFSKSECKIRFFYFLLPLQWFWLLFRVGEAQKSIENLIKINIKYCWKIVVFWIPFLIDFWLILGFQEDHFEVRISKKMHSKFN